MGKQSRRENRVKRREKIATEEVVARRIKPSLIILVLAIIGGIVAAVVKDWEWGIAIAVAGIIIAGAWESFSDPPDSRPGGSSDAINFGG